MCNIQKCGAKIFYLHRAGEVGILTISERICQTTVGNYFLLTIWWYAISLAEDACRHFVTRNQFLWHFSINQHPQTSPARPISLQIKMYYGRNLCNSVDTKQKEGVLHRMLPSDSPCVQDGKYLILCCCVYFSIKF